MSSERTNEPETMNNRMTKTVVILGIVIVWAFILAMDANAALEGTRWEGEVALSSLFLPGVSIGCAKGRK